MQNDGFRFVAVVTLLCALPGCDGSRLDEAKQEAIRQTQIAMEATSAAAAAQEAAKQNHDKLSAELIISNEKHEQVRQFASEQAKEVARLQTLNQELETLAKQREYQIKSLQISVVEATAKAKEATEKFAVLERQANDHMTESSNMQTEIDKLRDWNNELAAQLKEKPDDSKANGDSAVTKGQDADKR